MKKRPVRILMSVLVPVAVALILGILFSNPAEERPFYKKPTSAVMVYAHMGGDGIWPGDTLYAYDQAVTLGVDAFDMDAHY